MGFLILAACGIVIKTSASIIKSAMKVTIDGYDGDAEEARQFAAFILETAGK